MLGMGLLALIIRIYYAIHDTVTPMKVGLIALPLNAVLSVILVKFIGANGLALGTSISVLITTLIFVFDLNERLDLFEFERSGKTIIKITIASLTMAILIILVKNNLGPILNSSFGEEMALLILSVGVGITAYWTLLNKLKIIE